MAKSEVVDVVIAALMTALSVIVAAQARGAMRARQPEARRSAAGGATRQRRGLTVNPSTNSMGSGPQDRKELLVTTPTITGGNVLRRDEEVENAAALADALAGSAAPVALRLLQSKLAGTARSAFRTLLSLHGGEPTGDSVSERTRVRTIFDAFVAKFRLPASKLG